MIDFKDPLLIDQLQVRCTTTTFAALPVRYIDSCSSIYLSLVSVSLCYHESFDADDDDGRL